MSKKTKSQDGKQSKQKKPSIQIEDIPKDIEIDDDDLDSVSGGTTFRTSTTEPSQIIRPRPRPSPPKLGYPDK